MRISDWSSDVCSSDLLGDPDEIAHAALEIVRSGRAAHVAVTMGHNGAILASAAGPLFLPAAPIEAKSAVGAGDSFLSAMLFAISIGWEMGEAFRFGIAAGAAAVMSPRSEEHTSELQSLMRISYAVFCLKKKK